MSKLTTVSLSGTKYMLQNLPAATYLDLRENFVHGGVDVLHSEYGSLRERGGSAGSNAHHV